MTILWARAYNERPNPGIKHEIHDTSGRWRQGFTKIGRLTDYFPEENVSPLAYESPVITSWKFWKVELRSFNC